MKDELKKLFEQLPELGEVALTEQQHAAERAQRRANAKLEIIRQVLAWRKEGAR